jgi:hypothetical protein
MKTSWFIEMPTTHHSVTTQKTTVYKEKYAEVLPLSLKQMRGKSSRKLTPVLLRLSLILHANVIILMPESVVVELRV